MTYSTQVLADSPIVYWRLGETTGTTANDTSGNSRAGTYSGAPTLGSTGLLTGDADKAVTFNGSSQYVSIASAAWQNVSTFTVEAWIKPSSVAAGNHVIASRQDLSAGTGVWTLRLEGATLKFYYWNAGGTLQTALTATTTFVAGSIYHVVVTFTASGTATIYVNGSSVASATASTLLSVLPTFRVAASGAGEYFPGVIDEFAYYATALSSTRIGVHYTTGQTGGGTDISITAPFAFARAVALAPVFNEIIPVGSDTSNAMSGRSRGGLGLVEVTVPVEPLPAGVSLGKRYDKTAAYPTPTMVGGSPT